MAEPFPREDDLCESCGYPLRGVAATGFCPECGAAVEASDPRRRPGLPWQNRRSAGALLHTAAQVFFRPRRAFRQARVHDPRLPARLYLLTLATAASALWAGTAALTTRPNALGLVGGAILVGHAVIVLTYVEALGLAWIGRQRGWRTPLAVTETVACYAAVGWLPAVLIARALLGLLALAPPRVWLDPAYLPALGVTVAAIAMFAFEIYVFIGVRQVRYANT